MQKCLFGLLAILRGDHFRLQYGKEGGMGCWFQTVSGSSRCWLSSCWMHGALCTPVCVICTPTVSVYVSLLVLLEGFRTWNCIYHDNLFVSSTPRKFFLFLYTRIPPHHSGFSWVSVSSFHWTGVLNISCLSIDTWITIHLKCLQHKW